MTELKIGDKAPDFTLPADGGGQIALNDYTGKNLVIYFYPKDNTPGCTTEALDFTAHTPKFDAANTAILGVSKDSVKKHDNFIAKHDLKVRLISDQDSDMIERYGVWVQKKLYGREYMGIERATFLIDKNGKIVQIWRKVRVKGHAEQVLEQAQSL